MNTVRLVLNPEIKLALDFLTATEYPTLSYSEVFKVALAKEVTKVKRKSSKTSYFDKDPTVKELLIQADKIFTPDYKTKFWDDTNMKPISLKNNV
ncbi:hypothetical protein KBC75_03020 [Candidatus Shapirobacteria bacterium]|nr:hypothetical protein [Candidatus Shapirobacteria bacterium]